jgi:F0F1-type ATP synthase assembly protein I
MDILPWGVIIILGLGLSGTVYAICRILLLAYTEMRDD